MREITAADAEIRWTVELANLKAEWFQFDRALDIPEAEGTSVKRRNAAVKDRASLAIRPGPREIAPGADCAVPFDTGTFRGTPVYLGELRVDGEGRLLVLGGRGKSGSPSNAPLSKDAFNNADDWYDDTSDGPVTAIVTVGGRSLPCNPAWVVVAPPNYAPDLKAWRTAYDLRVDVARTTGALPVPERPSFTEDILPRLTRLSELQWVNAGFAALFGADGPLDFSSDPNLLRKLSQAPGSSDPYQELRRTIANSFRSRVGGDADPGTWPWIYGDGFGTGPDLAPVENLPLPPSWARLLDQWADGDFVADWDPTRSPRRTLAELCVAEQPAALDRAALDFCLADAFHPGCEMTWPIRHQTMFSSPFRIRHAEGPPVKLGDTLTPKIVRTVGGPLYGQRPGGLTRWMALPWQMDTAFCRSGYDHEYDPYLPTFWPARVPNQVLSTDAYEHVVDTGAERRARIEAFHDRADWLRRLPPGVRPGAEWMVAHFDTQGVVIRRPGVKGDPELPAAMWVEHLPADAERSAREAHDAQKQRIADAQAAGNASWAKAGWHEEADAEEAAAAYRRRS